MRNYLEFEAPIKELNEQIQKLKDSAVKTGVNVDTAVQELEKALLEKTEDRKSTRLNSSHSDRSRMPSSA